MLPIPVSLSFAYLYIVLNPANHALSRSACNVRCTLRRVRDASGRASATAHRGGRRPQDFEPVAAPSGAAEARPHHEAGGARGRPGAAQHQETRHRRERTRQTAIVATDEPSPLRQRFLLENDEDVE